MKLLGIFDNKACPVKINIFSLGPHITHGLFLIDVDLNLERTFHLHFHAAQKGQGLLRSRLIAVFPNEIKGVLAQAILKDSLLDLG